MNTKRVVGWVAFFGVAAALAWLPEYFKPADDGEADRRGRGHAGQRQNPWRAAGRASHGQAGGDQGPEPGRRPVRRPQLEGCADPGQRHRTTRQRRPGGAGPQLHRRCLSSSSAGWMTAPTCKCFCRTAKKSTSCAKGM